MALVNRPNLSGPLRDLLFILVGSASESAAVGCGGVQRCGAHGPYVNRHRHLSCHCFSSVNPQKLTGCHSSWALPLTHVKTSQIVSVCSIVLYFYDFYSHSKVWKNIVFKAKVIIFLRPFCYSRREVSIWIKVEKWEIKPRNCNTSLSVHLHLVTCVFRKQWCCTTGDVIFSFRLFNPFFMYL